MNVTSPHPGKDSMATEMRQFITITPTSPAIQIGSRFQKPKAMGCILQDTCDEASERNCKVSGQA